MEILAVLAVLGRKDQEALMEELVSLVTWAVVASQDLLVLQVLQATRDWQAQSDFPVARVFLDLLETLAEQDSLDRMECRGVEEWTEHQATQEPQAMQVRQGVQAGMETLGYQEDQAFQDQWETPVTMEMQAS